MDFGLPKAVSNLSQFASRLLNQFSRPSQVFAGRAMSPPPRV